MGPEGAVVAIIIILILAFAFIAITYQPLHDYINSFLGIQTSVHITGVSLELNALTNASCFGSVVQPLPGFYAQKGSGFDYTVNLTNSCASPHNITNVSVLNGGFSITSVSPKLPYEVFGNNKIQLSTLISPASGFNGGVLTIQVNVT